MHMKRNNMAYDHRKKVMHKKIIKLSMLNMVGSKQISIMFIFID